MSAAFQAFAGRMVITMLRANVDRSRVADDDLIFLRCIDANVPPTLDLHLILDNYGTHKTPMTKRWLLGRPRFHLHFTLTGSIVDEPRRIPVLRLPTATSHSRTRPRIMSVRGSCANGFAHALEQDGSRPRTSEPRQASSGALEKPCEDWTPMAGFSPPRDHLRLVDPLRDEHVRVAGVALVPV